MNKVIILEDRNVLSINRDLSKKNGNHDFLNLLNFLLKKNYKNRALIIPA